MANEWGPPLTGEEMKAIKGRIDPETIVQHWGFHRFQNLKFSGDGYHLPASHPYYKVREYNLKHGTNLVPHDGSSKVPKDWYGGGVLDKNLQFFSDVPDADYNWFNIIAYTPKQNDSEMPRDEAIEYVRKNFGWHEVAIDEIKRLPDVYKTPLTLARLIQQYEPDRLKPAVDVAAEAYAIAEWGGSGNHTERRAVTIEDFKAGAAWQKENGK